MPRDLYLVALERNKDHICNRIDSLVHDVLGLCYIPPTTSSKPNYKPFFYQTAKLYHPLEKGDSNSYVTRGAFQNSPELLRAFDEVIMLQQRLIDIDGLIEKHHELLLRRQSATAEHHFEVYRNLPLIDKISNKLRSLQVEKKSPATSQEQQAMINNKILALELCLKYLSANDPRLLAADSTTTPDLHSVTGPFSFFSQTNHNEESIKVCHYFKQQLSEFSSKKLGNAGYDNTRNSLLDGSTTNDLVEKSIDSIRLAVIANGSAKREQQTAGAYDVQQAQQLRHCAYRI